MQIKMSAVRALLLFTVMSCLFCDRTSSSSVQLASNNLEDILKSNELVFVNFYADWCRFSQMLKPIFNEAAEKIAKEFPEPGRIVFGRVDCDRETGIASQYHVSKYPTLKLFRHGSLIKREYRGQRSADAFTSYIRDQLRVPVQVVEQLEDLDNLERKKRNVVGYFDNPEAHEYLNFKSVANMLREDCHFHAAIGDISEKERISGNKIVFKPPGADKPDVLYTGPMEDYNHALQWATDKCVPLVREITFENAEELTEEGLPFMILFHNPTDTETPESYRRIVSKELMQEKSSINFLVADGLKFTHPLFHLGKSANDLPLLAIDSFRHMYLWKHSPKTDLETSGLLKQFVADLHSGKLHREFHHGPDVTKPAELPAVGGGTSDHVPNDEDTNGKQPSKPTTPPESTFKKLAPSRSRYTILRDEL